MIPLQLGIAYVILTTVLFVFPPAIPVTGSSMNYCIVVFAIVFIISMIQWIFDGRKNYKGPKIEIDNLVLTAAQSPADIANNRPAVATEAEHSEKSGSLPSKEV